MYKEMRLMKNKKGFSLIELLVVIAIIAILTTFLMANFVGIRQRGRDNLRKSDLNSIKSALEIYRSDNGHYPLAADFPSCGGQLSSNGAVYMSEVPCDPLDDSSYTYKEVGCGSSGCSGYEIVACLENENDSDKDLSKDSACTDSPASFTVTNP